MIFKWIKKYNLKKINNALNLFNFIKVVIDNEDSIDLKNGERAYLISETMLLRYFYSKEEWDKCYKLSEDEKLKTSFESYRRNNNLK